MTIRVVAVGDLVLGDSASTVGFGFTSTWSGSGLEPAFRNVADILRGGDIVFGNLEAVLSDRGKDAARGASLHMRGIPGFAADLRRAGFTLLNVANNHANQHGDEAFQDTCRHVREAGLQVCGLRGSGGWATEPVLVSLTGGRRAGVLSYCLHPRQYFPDRKPPFAEGTRDEIVADVRRLRREVASVIVSLHWGLEFMAAPSATQVELADLVVAAGACLVLGHHSHVVGPFTRTGTAVVAYGLGNFVSDMLWDESLRRGAVLVADLDGDSVPNAEVVQTRLDSNGAPTPAERGAMPAGPVEGVADNEHRRRSRLETERLRRAKGRYLVANLHRMNPRYALQWVAKVIRNRLSPR
jgi:poly-gamma-glutamate synthesis protein (capsule biosynthesis protein)